MVNKVIVRLKGLSHTYPDDIDALLVGPGGQKVIFMSDVGGNNAVSGLTLVFDDASTLSMPDRNKLISATYKPTNVSGGDIFPSPAPGGAYGSTLTGFNNTNPNGVWQLFIKDDSGGNTGSILNGWELTLVTK